MTFGYFQELLGCRNIGSETLAEAQTALQFPWRLHDMLKLAEKRGEEYIVAWIDDGKAFKVHRRKV